MQSAIFTTHTVPGLRATAASAWTSDCVASGYYGVLDAGAVEADARRSFEIVNALVAVADPE